MVSLGHLRPCWGNWGCIGEIEAMSGLCWALCWAINLGTNGFARGEGVLNTTSPKRFYFLWLGIGRGARRASDMTMVF